MGEYAVEGVDLAFSIFLLISLLKKNNNPSQLVRQGSSDSSMRLEDLVIKH